MDRIAGWWDGFELWVAGLPFIPQFLVVLVGMVPISFAIAYLLDRGLRLVLRMFGHRRGPGKRGNRVVTRIDDMPVHERILPAAQAVREHAGSGVG